LFSALSWQPEIAFSPGWKSFEMYALKSQNYAFFFAWRSFVQIPISSMQVFFGFPLVDVSSVSNMYFLLHLPALPLETKTHATQARAFPKGWC
jgi:hypothetical protein